MKTKDTKQVSANVGQRKFSGAMMLAWVSFAVFTFLSTAALAQNDADPFSMDPNNQGKQKSQSAPAPNEGAMINDLDTLFNDAASNADTPPQPIAAGEKASALPPNPATATPLTTPGAVAAQPEPVVPATAPVPAPATAPVPAPATAPVPAPATAPVPAPATAPVPAPATAPAPVPVTAPPVTPTAEELNPGGLNITTPAAPLLATVPLPPQEESTPSASGPALPRPAWQNMSEEAPAEVSGNRPLPQFDASQSNWQQMEVGQAESFNNNSASTKTVNGNLSAMPPIPDNGADTAANDTAQTDQTTDTAPKVYESEERAKLRHLFSDLLPPESPKASPAATASKTAPASPPQAGQEKVTPQKAEPKNSPPKEITPLKIEDANPTLKPEKAVKESEENGPAILRAGSLLTTETTQGELNTVAGNSPNETSLAGAAEILLPGDSKAKGSKTQSSAKKVTTSEAKANSSKSNSAQAKSTPKKGKASSSKKASSKKTARPAGQLTIINETGRNGAAESYRTVLTQMGYTVLSVAEGQSAATGSTIITYRAGLKAKAQNLARHLPGPKVLVEAKDPAMVPSELLVQIR